MISTEKLQRTIEVIKVMRETLEEIAKNPCLSPEGNAEIARIALERIK